MDVSIITAAQHQSLSLKPFRVRSPKLSPMYQEMVTSFCGNYADTTDSEFDSHKSFVEKACALPENSLTLGSMLITTIRRYGLYMQCGTIRQIFFYLSPYQKGLYQFRVRKYNREGFINITAFLSSIINKRMLTNLCKTHIIDLI